jgi:hypothetical protein
MVDVRMFDTIEEMQVFLAENQKAADTQIKDWQRAVRPGDFIMRFADFGGEMLAIYGEILDAIELERPHHDMGSFEDRMEFEAVQDRYKVDGHWHQSFRFGRFYSPLCDEGEYGDIHLSTITCVITADLFQMARAAGWPQPVQASPTVE